MGEGPSGLIIKKPVRDLNRLIQFDFRESFKALTKIAVNAVAGNVPSALEGGAELLVARRAEADASEIAWLLIRRALGRAMAEVAVAALRGKGREPKDKDGLISALDLSLEAKEIVVSRSFFERPDHLPLLDDVRSPFSQWLAGFGLEEADVVRCLNKLPLAFARSVGREWQRAPDDYRPIKEVVETPFTRGEEIASAWIAYWALLEAMFREPIFEEAFGLDQIYIPLRGYYEERIEEKDEEIGNREFGLERKKRRVVVDLAGHLNAWLEPGNKDDALRVICGGPGCGKSSFAKAWVASLAAESRLPVAFLPLHRFDVGDDLARSIGAFLRDAELLPHNPLDPDRGEKRLLLVLDGLDELAMQGRAGQEAAAELLERLNRLLSTRNFGALRLQAVVGGRQTIVDALRGKLSDHQVLHVLSYYVPEHERAEYSDAMKRLEADQRSQWWRRFGELKGRNLSGLPEQLRTGELDEVTAQPLLNYLVALSWLRGKIGSTAISNVNEVYADLVDAVYERRWGAGRLPEHERLTKAEFERVFEEIALAAWHEGDSRRASVSQIERVCARRGLTAKLAAFERGAEHGAVSLLSAFYFRHSGFTREGERAFELTHKSFGEYLVNRRITGIARQIFIERQRRDADFDTGWDERMALAFWVEVTGPTTLDADLLDFLRRDAERLSASDACDLRQILANLITWTQVHGMPIEEVKTSPRSFGQQCAWARNAEETLLAVLNGLARHTKKLSSFPCNGCNELYLMLKRLQANPMGPENPLAMECLSYFDFGKQLSVCTDFFAADLQSANLPGSNLAWCLLFDANLRGASL